MHSLPLSSLLPSVVEISKQNRHRTFDIIQKYLDPCKRRGKPFVPSFFFHQLVCQYCGVNHYLIWPGTQNRKCADSRAWCGEFKSRIMNLDWQCDHKALYWFCPSNWRSVLTVYGPCAASTTAFEPHEPLWRGAIITHCPTYMVFSPVASGQKGHLPHQWLASLMTCKKQHLS